MTTLAQNLSDSATQMWVNAAVAEADRSEEYTIDTEVVRVTAYSTTVMEGLSPERTDYDTLWQIERGVGPTSVASHTAGATLTPFPGAGGGAGGVTVDNTIDAPAEVTSIVAAGATIVGDEATLRGKDFYAQDTDPGAVGAGSVWKDTIGGVLWNRNATNDGWLAEFQVQVDALDSNDVYANASATNTFGGGAFAGPVAITAGGGDANAGPQATSSGTGAAVAGLWAQANDSGAADVSALAIANTGSATAGSLATRGAASAGMSAVVDGTSARLAFNGTTPIAIPVIPAVPTEQDIADVLVALGLATQTP